MGASGVSSHIRVLYLELGTTGYGVQVVLKITAAY